MKIIKPSHSIDWWNIPLEPLAKNGTSTDCSKFICYSVYVDSINTTSDWCNVPSESPVKKMSLVPEC